MFAEKIIHWYHTHGRELPWRTTSDPYKIWVSEIILQQTRISQGLPYYLEFINAFPTVKRLADADESEVLKIWQGLGYYSRARNMMKTAKLVMSKYQGEFPHTYESLKDLPGIGDYTASAIASFAFGKHHPVVDGNVKRVVSRFCGIDIPVDSGKAVRMIKDFLQEQINAQDPGTFNQAVLDFGATHCKPRKPGCESCIFKDRCVAFQYDKVNLLPVKSAKNKVKDRYFNYIIVIQRSKDGNEYLLQKRNKNDIWKGLYEFLLIETLGYFDIDKLVETTLWKKWFENKAPVIHHSSKLYTHKLSHRRIHAKFYLVSPGEKLKVPKTLNVTSEKIYNYPVSRLMEQFMEDYPHWISGD
jgi:A/G-specific adenine glycosylase